VTLLEMLRDTKVVKLTGAYDLPGDFRASLREWRHSAVTTGPKKTGRPGPSPGS
jgi:hypothetical protein